MCKYCEGDHPIYVEPEFQTGNQYYLYCDDGWKLYKDTNITMFNFEFEFCPRCGAPMEV